MSRGKQYKTILKEAVLQAAGVAEAIKLGELRAERKDHLKKPFMESAREHFGKMIDRIDPLELVAVIAGTYIVHETIVTIESTMSKLTNLTTKSVSQNPSLAPLFALNPIIGGLMIALQNGLNLNQNPNEVKETPKQEQITPSTIMVWSVSFLIAYLLVKKAQTANFASIMELLVGIGLG